MDQEEDLQEEHKRNWKPASFLNRDFSYPSLRPGMPYDQTAPTVSGRKLGEHR